MLETLLDRSGGTALPLPEALVRAYGGPLRVPPAYVFAIFVSTLDGVVSYAEPGLEGAWHVSASHPADRFVLALLRATADAVIVGAGTLRKEPETVWTPESVYPEGAAELAEVRAALRVPPHPLTVFVSASGDIDLALPVFAAGDPIAIATTDPGARRIGPTPRHVSVHVVAGDGDLDPAGVVALARRLVRGDRILTEGGPHLLGRFLAARVVDELFLTIAPRLAGRTETLRRLALVEGTAFTPPNKVETRLMSLKVADDYLFTRYALA